jgi:hypothetical protein
MIRDFLKIAFLGMILFAVALSGGCKDEKKSVVPADVAQDRLCIEMAEIMCHNFFQCCTGEEIEERFGISIEASEEECREDVELLCEQENADLMYSVANNRVQLNVNNINACLDEHIAPEDNCFPVVTNFAPSCDAPLTTGRQRAGAGCLFHTDCVRNTYCGNDRTCKPLPERGDECELRWGCAAGLFCGYNEGSDTYRCEERKPEDNGCNYDTPGKASECQDGLVCKPREEENTEGFNGICKELKQNGEACEENLDCASNFCLPAMCEDGERTCFHPDDCLGYCERTTDRSCAADSQCPGHCDDGSTCEEDCPSDCHRETCVGGGQCDGEPVCANRHAQANFCDISLLGIFKCRRGEFRCDNGECIPAVAVCDDIFDCNDGSDERSSACGFSLCGPDEFQCTDMTCIPIEQFCDDVVDCGDGSDEFC